MLTRLAKSAFQNGLIAHIPSHVHQLEAGLGYQVFVFLLSALLRIQAGVHLKIQSAGRCVPPVCQEWFRGHEWVVLLLVTAGAESGTYDMFTNEKLVLLRHDRCAAA